MAHRYASNAGIDLHTVIDAAGVNTHGHDAPPGVSTREHIPVPRSKRMADIAARNRGINTDLPPDAVKPAHKIVPPQSAKPKPKIGLFSRIFGESTIEGERRTAELNKAHEPKRTPTGEWLKKVDQGPWPSPHEIQRTVDMENKAKPTKIKDAIEAVVTGIMTEMAPFVDEDTMTGNIASIPLPMGNPAETREEPCPCGSGLPKSKCPCGRQTTPIIKALDTMAGRNTTPPIRGNRQRKIVSVLGGL